MRTILFRLAVTAATAGIIMSGFTSTASADTGSLDASTLTADAVSSSLASSVDLGSSLWVAFGDRDVPQNQDVSQFRKMPIRVDDNCVADPAAGLTAAEAAEILAWCER